MEKTKSDLDWNTVTLDYKALHDTARMAVYMKCEEINKYRTRILNVLRDDAQNNINLEASWLKSAADALQIAAETFYALHEGQGREKVVIVNHEVNKPSQR